jgi:hypothetical protein
MTPTMSRPEMILKALRVVGDDQSKQRPETRVAVSVPPAMLQDVRQAIQDAPEMSNIQKAKNLDHLHRFGKVLDVTAMRGPASDSFPATEGGAGVPLQDKILDAMPGGTEMDKLMRGYDQLPDPTEKRGFSPADDPRYEQQRKELDKQAPLEVLFSQGSDRSPAFARKQSTLEELVEQALEIRRKRAEIEKKRKPITEEEIDKELTEQEEEAAFSGEKLPPYGRIKKK